MAPIISRIARLGNRERICGFPDIRRESQEFWPNRPSRVEAENPLAPKEIHSLLVTSDLAPHFKFVHDCPCKGSNKQFFEN